MTNADFAQVLAAAIRRKGCKKTDLAKACGVAPQTVSRWLSGEDQPHGRRLHAMAAFLDAPELALGAEGEDKIDAAVLEKLLQIAERAMIGQSVPEAATRVLPGVAMTEAERRLLARAAPGIRRELTEAANEEWELLPEQERRRVVAAIAARHLQLPDGDE